MTATPRIPLRRPRVAAALLLAAGAGALAAPPAKKGAAAAAGRAAAMPAAGLGLGPGRPPRPTAPTSTGPRSSATASCRRCSTSCPGRSRSPATSRAGRRSACSTRRSRRSIARSSAARSTTTRRRRRASRARRCRQARQVTPHPFHPIHRFTRRSPHGHLQHRRQVLPGLRPVHLPERADHGARHRHLDRALPLPQQGAQPEPQGLGRGAADAAEGPVPRRAGRDLALRRRGQQDRQLRPDADAEPRPARGLRRGDGGRHDGDRAAPREAHPLHRHLRQRDHAGRPARHHHRPDQGLHRGGPGQPGGEGGDALGLDLDRDEQHRVRADGGDPVPADPLVPAGQDERDRRRPRGGEDQLPEPGAAAARRATRAGARAERHPHRRRRP